MDATPLRILIVDDCIDAARMLKLLLKSEGHEAHIASDGREAIAAAALVRPHVVLLDLTLPGMSGLDVAAELRRDPERSGCVLVAISGHGAEILPSPSPFDRCFEKPLDPSSLLDYLTGIEARRTPTSRTAAAVASDDGSHQPYGGRGKGGSSATTPEGPGKDAR
jgi:CheY-like chemotaxis protein